MGSRVDAAPALGLALAVGLAASACSGGGGSIVGSSGEVAQTRIRTDTFQQVRRPRYDFLWVVDDTRSMEDKHPLLLETYRAFFAQIADAGIAYQVGIVTADLLEAGGGRLRGDPWILTPDTANARDRFVDGVQVKTSDDAYNHGLEAMRAALSPPLSTDANRGFVRAEAQLNIYFVSDSDDASTWPGTGCIAGDVNASSGDRYARLVSLTGGVAVSICDPGAALTSAPLTLPERLTSFPLTETPASDQIAVWVDAERIPQSLWALDGKALLFSDQAIPDYDASIRVQYLYELPEEAP